nr:hypothetical protein [Mycoplasmopsis bovis]
MAKWKKITHSTSGGDFIRLLFDQELNKKAFIIFQLIFANSSF